VKCLVVRWICYCWNCGGMFGWWWKMVVTYNNMFKGGDERPHGMWWVVSFSPPKCEFSPSSQDRACTHAWGLCNCRNPHRLNNSGGASQGPLVRASICACVLMVGWTEMRIVVLGKWVAVGRGVAGTWQSCRHWWSWKVLNEGEVDTAPTQPALQGRGLKAR